MDLGCACGEQLAQRIPARFGEQFGIKVALQASYAERSGTV